MPVKGMHHHAPVRKLRRERAFFGCVNALACDERSHGNVTILDVCRCGATRSMNCNAGVSESSGWIAGDDWGPTYGAWRP